MRNDAQAAFIRRAAEIADDKDLVIECRAVLQIGKAAGGAASLVQKIACPYSNRGWRFWQVSYAFDFAF
jgi:hypothetical protein